MSRETTAVRIRTKLTDMSWPTASELAAEVRMSAGTVRKYLTEAVIDGTVERRIDGTTSNPTGAGAGRYRVREVPLGPQQPVDLLLCVSCAWDQCGDELRYRHALTRDEFAEVDDPDDSVYDANVEAARCERCGQPRYR